MGSFDLFSCVLRTLVVNYMAQVLKYKYSVSSPQIEEPYLINTGPDH